MARTAFRSRGHSCRPGRTHSGRAAEEPRFSSAEEETTALRKQEWCGVEETCLVGGKARDSASLTKHESANMMSPDFTSFTQQRGDSRCVA